MLRNRVTSKQKALMADHTLSSLSPTATKNPTTKISSFLNSPRFLNGFLSKSLIDHPESTAMSPTSILDKQNSPTTFVNPFGYDKKIQSLDKIENPCSKLEPQAIGLALIDSIIEDKNDDNMFKPVNRMVLFGSKLKVQIPSVGSNPSYVHSPTESPESPADFGIKTKNCQMIMSPFCSSRSTTPVKDFSRQLSLKEMELSEDYTCVISHGPNKKTVHIYDDCVVERCDGDGDYDDDGGDDDTSVVDEKKMECGGAASVDFLSFCYNCGRSLEQGEDIYMYRGEKAFCSQECRGQEMLFELKNPDSD